MTRTYSQNAPYIQVLKTQVNGLASLVKWLSVYLRTQWLWVWVQLQSYKSYIIYKVGGFCSLHYIGESKRNAEVRWNEENNPTKSSEPSKHLWSNINHNFTWAVISNAQKNSNTRKNSEASCIALWKPDLNEQEGFERLVLFRNGVI